MFEQFLHGSYHTVQSVDKRLAWIQSWEPIKQVLFSERVDFLDLSLTLLTPNEEENRQDFLVGESRFRIIAVSLAVAIQSLLVLWANVHVDFDKF